MPLQEAEKSIRFYQNLKEDKDYEVLQSEINKLKSTLDSGNTEKSGGNSLKCSDIITGAGRKAMTIGIVLAGVNQLCGCFAMLQYTASIFEEAGSNMSPNMSAIVVGVIQLLGSYVATNLVDRTGRKVNVFLLLFFKTINLNINLFGLVFVHSINRWNCHGFNFFGSLYDAKIVRCCS